MSCDIIVVKYGLPELEAECAASVEEHTEGDYTLTLHDNYEADENLSKVWNDCIRASDAEYICLLNNDTRIEEDGWLTKLLEAFDTIENLGAIGPVTNKASGPQGNGKWRKRKGPGAIEVGGPLVGFCMVFPKRLWAEIGEFDEGYALYGEDSDFCMGLLKNGYKLAIHSDVFVFHHGKASTPIAEARGKDILALIKESRLRYRQKWFPNKISAKEKQAVVAKREADSHRFKDPVKQAAFNEEQKRRERFLECKAEKKAEKEKEENDQS